MSSSASNTPSVRADRDPGARLEAPSTRTADGTRERGVTSRNHERPLTKSWHHSIYCAWRDGEACNCKERKPILLDLFCGAGGATKGYQRAGFYVIGVDIKPQPRYCGDAFHQAEALEFLEEAIDKFAPFNYCDAIHASPPCQSFTDLKSMWNAGEHEDLLTPTRALLELISDEVPYVIENVEGAPMKNAVTICGSSLALRVRRHRLFETNWPLMVMPCAHGQQGTPVGVYGTGGGGQMTRGYKARGVEEAREVMGTPWMTLAECSQAIPPAYTEFIGEQLMAHLTLIGTRTVERAYGL